MNRLTDFFKGNDSSAGVFYPSHHIVAVFPDRNSAQEAEQALQKTGVGPDQAISVGAGEVKEFAAEHVERNGLFGLLMSKISDAIGTEQTYQNYDLDSAGDGAGFVAVRCPTEESKKRIWDVLRGMHPLNARYYAPGGIEHLTGEV
ncbi:hypothetical protein F183_A53560 [Bryobacterales bacterium F-183]|nr:hypothetical protein F183_A53560 [Bryobacterales bacterium F-183]